MLTRKQLDKMSRQEIQKLDKSTLKNIDEVNIDISLPTDLRMKSYLEQIKNPYCFICEKMPVQIVFKEGGKSLNDLLYSYFANLKKGGAAEKI